MEVAIEDDIGALAVRKSLDFCQRSEITVKATHDVEHVGD
jgi:hypothetical protein